MRVADSIIQARRKALAELLKNRHYLPIAEVCTHFGISKATALRDLDVLLKEKKIKRTFGGALDNFDATFTSFVDRRAVDYGAKAAVAQKARVFVEEYGVCFFDSGTTIFALAEVLCREPVAGLRAVTNSLPVAEMLGRTQGELHLLGGRFLRQQSILLGSAARRSARLWQFDQVFLGAEGFSAAGIWASEPEVAKFQNTLIAQADQVYVCAHSTKLNRETGVFLAPWSSKIHLITDAEFTPPATNNLSSEPPPSSSLLKQGTPISSTGLSATHGSPPQGWREALAEILLPRREQQYEGAEQTASAP
jgi:DeoR family transcriptional regulator, aga operon transcriptional repressor